MAKSYICVGGPKDGQRVQVRDGCEYFRVALDPHYHYKLLYPQMSVEHVDIEIVEYRRQVIPIDDEDLVEVSLWAPSTQSLRRTIELLLETYHQTRRAT